MTTRTCLFSTAYARTTRDWWCVQSAICKRPAASQSRVVTHESHRPLSVPFFAPLLLLLLIVFELDLTCVRSLCCEMPITGGATGDRQRDVQWRRFEPAAHAEYAARTCMDSGRLGVYLLTGRPRAFMVSAGAQPGDPVTGFGVNGILALLSNRTPPRDQGRWNPR